MTVHKGTGTSAGAVCYLGNKAESWAASIPHDVRFTTSNGETQLKYWIETSDTSSATIWIKFDSIGTTDTDFYIYYGKAADTTTTSGGDTFAFYDDFPGVALNTDKWDGDTASASVASSQVTLSSTSGSKRIYAKTAFGLNHAVRAYAQLACTVAGHSNEVGFRASDGADRCQFVKYISAGDFENFIAASRKDAGTVTNLSTGVTRDANWHIFNSMRVSSSSAKYQIGTAAAVEITTNIATADMPASFHAFHVTSGTSTVVCEWMAVRKYIEPEPTYESWGSEETCIPFRSIYPHILIR